jgi:GrpB-like predicted nucleotidyltransferase (UPF0157 family)
MAELNNDDSVLIQDYDSSWPHAFSKLATRVKAALGSLVVTIEHIGSTAVPGLAAKPIIDLDVVLASSADLPEAIRLLTIIGYAHEGDRGIPGREAFRSPPDDPRHHLYVVSAGANELRLHLTFRDALRADRDLREKYAALKRSLAVQYKNDRNSYTQGKSDFIASIVK